MSESLTYKALVIREIQKDGKTLFQKSIETFSLDKLIHSLEENEVIIKVQYSSLNYKDALSSIGNKGVTRNYPHIPGIDAAGLILKATASSFQEGEEVYVTGHDLGMNTWGGFGEYIKVPASWVLKRPSHLSLRELMILGTAGFTAGLGLVNLIERANLKITDGPILVTGSSGGVGSLAVLILSHLGYEVSALTTKESSHEYLKNLGATRILTSSEFEELKTSTKGLLRGQWSGVFDCVGGEVLATALKCLKMEGAATTCGNVGGVEFQSSIFPFIIRGVDLFGINSAETPADLRAYVWKKLNESWRPPFEKLIVYESDLKNLKDVWIDQILTSKLLGRVLVTHF